MVKVRVARRRGRGSQKGTDQTHIPEADRLAAWMKIIRRERKGWWGLDLQHKVGLPLATHLHTHRDTHTKHTHSMHSRLTGSI